MDKASLGDHLRSIRNQLGLSQEKVAELCNICEKTYGRLERGQANVTLSVLHKLEGGLGISVVNILQKHIPDEPGLWEYFAILEPCLVPYVSCKYTYGVMACKNTPTGRYCVAVIHDVSTKCDFITDLMEYFNSYALSPAHLTAVLYDMLP